jgi:hypothetical protein
MARTGTWSDPMNVEAGSSQVLLLVAVALVTDRAADNNR